jgi:hypothetical protein
MSDLLDDLNSSEASELQTHAEQYLKPSSSISLLLSLLASPP